MNSNKKECTNAPGQMVYRQTLHVKHLDITSGIWPETELLSVSFKQLKI